MQFEKVEVAEPIYDFASVVIIDSLIIPHQQSSYAKAKISYPSTRLFCFCCFGGGFLTYRSSIRQLLAVTEARKIVDALMSQVGGKMPVVVQISMAEMQNQMGQLMQKIHKIQQEAVAD